jgi:hypothetical protein
MDVNPTAFREAGMKKAILIAVAALSLTVAPTISARPSTSSGVRCAAGLNSGYGLKATYLAQGSPAWMVRALCGVVRRSGFTDGFQAGATKLVCGGHMRSYPHVIAGLYASPDGAAVARRSCSGMFSRSTWVRLR